MTEPNELCESERLRKLPFRGDDSIEEDEVEEKDGDRKLLLLLVLLLVGLSAPLHKNRAPLSSQARSNN